MLRGRGSVAGRGQLTDSGCSSGNKSDKSLPHNYRSTKKISALK
jgi:hypothetical protein